MFLTERRFQTVVDALHASLLSMLFCTFGGCSWMVVVREDSSDYYIKRLKMRWFLKDDNDRLMSYVNNK